MTHNIRRALSVVLFLLAIGIIVWQGRIASEHQHRRAEAEKRLDTALWGASNGLFDWMLTDSTDILTTRDHVWFDARFNAVLGLPQGGLCDQWRCFVDLVYPADRVILRDALAHAIEYRSSTVVEFQATHTDGMPHWYELRARFSQNGHRRISGSLLDVTEIRMTRLRANWITMLSVDPIVVCDQRGVISLLNPAAEKLLGLPSDKAQDHALSEFMAPGSFEEHLQAIRATVAELQAQTQDWTIYKMGFRRDIRAADGTITPTLMDVYGVKYRGHIEFVSRWRPVGANEAEKPQTRSKPLPAEVTQSRAWAVRR